jgi:hypothetical protein
MKVSVTIGAEQGKFVGGTTAANWRIEAQSGGTVAFEYDEGTEPTTDFDMPEGQTYALRGWRMDANHQVLGEIASMEYSVGEDLAVIWVATSLTAKAAPPEVTPVG